MIAMNTPEENETEMERNAAKQRKGTKKNKNAKLTLY